MPFIGKTGVQSWQKRAVERSDSSESKLLGKRIVCKVVREDERLAHTLDGKQAILGIVLSVCEKDFCGDTRTEESDEIKNIVLERSVREKVEEIREE